MASPLNSLINSYTLERGLELDQSYTLTPTRTGSNSNGTFSLAGITPTYESAVGPNNGGGSWKFSSPRTGSGSTGASYFRVTSGASTTDLTGFSDNDFTLGFWWKLNNKVTSQYNTENEIVMLKAGNFEIAYSSSLFSSPNRIVYSIDGSSYATLESTNSTNIAADTWYHIAVRRETGTWKFYLNGTLVRTLTNSTTITPAIFGFGSGNTTGASTSADMTWNICNFYYGTSANLTEANIQRINDVGFDKHKKAITTIAATPYVWLQMDDVYSSTDIIKNSGSLGTDLNLSGSNGSAYQRVAASGAVDGYAIDFMSGFAGFDTSLTLNYSATNSMSFWFKRASAPGTSTSYIYMNLNSDNTSSSTSHNKIGTNGYLYWAPRIGGSNVTEINSGMSICDNNWHHVVLTRSTNTHKLYIDGSLKSSTTSGGTGNIASAQFNIGQNSSLWDEFVLFDGIELTSTQVTDLYNASPYAAININYTNTTGANVTTSTFPMPAISVQKTVTYSSGVLGTASADAVHPASSTDVNLDAFGVATASADIVNPTIFVEKSISYTADPSTASALFADPVVSATKTVSYSASPATASALLSSNNYYGPTTQDSTYTLSIRQIGATTNTDGKNGFSIGSQYTNSNLDSKTSLLIREVGGVPTLGTVIKAKFDSSHVTASASGDQNGSNTFNIYVFTEAPANWTTFTYANLPAKALISTTRLVDDASNTQFYLDLTAAANDSRAYTYGIFIEHVGTPPYSSTVYDRTEFSGTGLDTKLLYLLTSDFVNKNVNADPGNVTNSTLPMPVISTQIYVDFAAGVQTASADIVNPGLDVQDYVDYASGTLTASAESVQPAFNSTVEYTTLDLEAFAAAVQPTISATATVSYSSGPLTASALLHMPQFDVGENNAADHMDASALFVNPTIVINNIEAANPMIATDAMLVDPAQAVVLNALYAASRMTANANLVQPPGYTTLFDDKWYDLLFTQHSRRHGVRIPLSNETGEAILKLFDDVTSSKGIGSTVVNNLPNYIVLDSGTDTANPTMSVFGEFNPSTNAALISTGYFDDRARKAVRFNNITTGYNNSSSFTPEFTFEMSIKTTKLDQIISYGNWSSTYGNQRRSTALGITDGKLFINSTQAIGPAPLKHFKELTQLEQQYVHIGNKNIADGEWHHIVVQYGYGDNRLQFWIDGNLDIQRFDTDRIEVLNFLGHNASTSTYASDFFTSAWSYDTHRFISELEIDEHYYAYINFEPVRAEPMIASVNIGDHLAGGNRGRALMLYWWPTDTFQGAPYPPVYDNYSIETGSPTFDTSLTTADFIKSGPQEYYGWDIFPVDISGKYVSDLVKPEAYGGAKNIAVGSKPFIGTGQNYNTNPEYLYNVRGSFRDPITDAPRYIDLINDIDLRNFDAILFRNFPDEPREKDEFTGTQVVDSFFNLRETVLYENFIKSLRAAVDTGISLYITNYQLALDLKIIDRVEPVSNMNEIVGFDSDPYSPTLVEGGSTYPTTFAAYWADSFRNNKFRVVNLLEGLTSQPSMIWKEYAYYENDDQNVFGGPNRAYMKYEYRPNGLQIGDEFIMSNEEVTARDREYLAVPFNNVKAGIVITAFANQVRRGTELITNPYRNYATCIAVRPGDVLDGKQCGGKIVVNFTENINGSRDNGIVDLVTDYWINKAFEDGTITEAQKNTYLNATYNLDRQLANGTITQEQYNQKTYWDKNGLYIVSEAVQINDPLDPTPRSGLGKDQRTQVVNKINKSGDPSTTKVTTSQQWFSFKYAYLYPVATIRLPSILTRGFWWLSNRLAGTGLINRPLALTSSAIMVNPIVVADKDNSITVQSMVSSARSVAPANYVGADAKYISLPMTATGFINGFVTGHRAVPMTGSAVFRENISVFSSQVDEVVLYIYHTDPILYLREEVIK